MKNKGFTLVELLAVVTIFSIICVLAIPPILNQVNKNKSAVSDASLDIIYKATDLYNGTVTANKLYCVTLKELVEKDLLATPIKDFDTGGELDLNRVVRVTTDANKKKSYLLLKTGEECAIKIDYSAYNHEPRVVTALENGSKQITDPNAFYFDAASGTVSSYNISIGGPDVIIPFSINGVPVKSIGYMTFTDKSIKSLVMPNTITTIGSSIAMSTELGSLVIPNSVTKINDSAFLNSKIGSLTLSNSLTTIESDVFKGNIINQIVIPDGVKVIKRGAFADNRASIISSIPKSVTTIEDGSFTGNYVSGLYIPTTTYVGAAAFDRGVAIIRY